MPGKNVLSTSYPLRDHARLSMHVRAAWPPNCRCRPHDHRCHLYQDRALGDSGSYARHRHSHRHAPAQSRADGVHHAGICCSRSLELPLGARPCVPLSVWAATRSQHQVDWSHRRRQLELGLCGGIEPVLGQRRISPGGRRLEASPCRLSRDCLAPNHAILSTYCGDKSHAERQLGDGPVAGNSLAPWGRGGCGDAALHRRDLALRGRETTI